MVAAGLLALLAAAKRLGLPARPWFLIAALLPPGLLQIATALARSRGAALLETALDLIHVGYVASLLAVAAWWLARGRGRRAALALPSPPASLDDEIRAMLASGRKIEAIRLLRERTGLGLKDAKDHVEALQARQV